MSGQRCTGRVSERRWTRQEERGRSLKNPTTLASRLCTLVAGLSADDDQASKAGKSNRRKEDDATSYPCFPLSFAKERVNERETLFSLSLSAAHVRLRLAFPRRFRSLFSA